MNRTGKKIKQYTDGYCITPNAEKINETISLSGKAFLSYEEEVSLSYPEFMYQQSRYIQKRWWMLQCAVLCFLWLALKNGAPDIYVQKTMGLVAPIFGMLIIPEIWKNRDCASVEVEGASYYSLRQIYAVRILLFAIVDLTLLSLLAIGIVAGQGIPFIQFLVNFMIPFTVTCCICFRVLCSRRNASELFAIFLCVAWDALWSMVVMSERIYEVVSIPVWCGLLLAAFGYLLYCIRRLGRNCDELWEVEYLWN